MFTKKYIFETKKTKSRRFFRSTLLSLCLIGVSIILLAVYLPIHAQKQNEISAQAFFKRSPDLISVFTGDTGRIAKALKKVEKHPTTKIFITGVYSKNNLEILIKKQGKNTSISEFLEQESHHIELDYLARNTLENALATIHYAKKFPEVKNILIISSDYHILRISKIITAIQDENSPYSFYYESTSGQYNNSRSLKKLFKEVYKFLRTAIFLFFWEGKA